MVVKNMNAFLQRLDILFWINFRFWSSGMSCSVPKVFGDSIQFHWGLDEFLMVRCTVMHYFLCFSIWIIFVYLIIILGQGIFKPRILVQGILLLGILGDSFVLSQ